ncbi:MAG: 30S ribosome-binding factor RbfA [Victivallaceae bacterium]
MSKVPRMLRVNEILKREIADTLERENIASHGLLVSVTEVKTAPDLHNAQVFISVFGGTEYQKLEIIKCLEKVRHHIQKAIAKDIVLKFTPVLEFKLDRRVESGDKVISLIEGLGHEEKE